MMTAGKEHAEHPPEDSHAVNISKLLSKHLTIACERGSLKSFLFVIADPSTVNFQLGLGCQCAGCIASMRDCLERSIARLDAIETSPTEQVH